MRKKIILILALFIATNLFAANNVLQYELKANEEIFKKGFEAGLKALEFQRKNDGYAPKKVIIQKEYYITYDITKMPYSDAIFLQNIASKEGFDTYITKDKLYFGEFEREADAKEAIEDLKSKFKITAKINQKKDNEFLITYPKLWGEFYTYIIKKAQELGYVVKIEVIEAQPKAKKVYIPKKTNVANTKTVQPATKKYFTLKNIKAMAYTATDKMDSKSYKDKGLVGKRRFELSKEGLIKTEQGESYYKVDGENLYFSDRDVELLK